MILVCLLTASLETELDDSKPRVSKYKIVDIRPTEVSCEGGESLIIEVEPDPVGVPFCKFGEKIVPAFHFSERKIRCDTPELEQGIVNVSISFDRVKWSNPFPILVLAKSSSPLMWILSFILLISIIFIGLRLRKILCRPRKKRIIRKRRRILRNSLKADKDVSVHRRGQTQTV